ncbi:hypothetical protein T484DRAFT_1922867 [Baffinella frigidus]|nr:hypothetical protein T484DRAFT_1922867 [Cryptophyta sp. CCMP2293]
MDPTAQVTTVNRVSTTIIAAGRRSGEILLAQIPSLQRAELSTYLAHLGPTAGVCVVMPGGGGAGAPGTPRVVSGGMDDRMDVQSVGAQVVQWRVRLPMAEKRRALPADLTCLIQPRPDESRGVNASLLQAGILAPRQLGMGGGGGGDAEGEKGEMHWSVNKPEPPGGVGALSST